MAILIKGIDIPKYESLTIKIMPSGAVCDQYGRLDERVKAVEVPTPHGRLIDADAFKALWDGATVTGDIGVLIEARPTIIETEE